MRRQPLFLVTLIYVVLAIGMLAVMVPAAAQETTEPPDTAAADRIRAILAPELFLRGVSPIALVQEGVEASQEQLRAAQRDLTLAIYLNPTFSEAYYSRGLVQLALGDGEAAAADLSRAIAWLPDDDPDYAAELYRLQGRLLSELGRTDEAIALFTEALEQTGPSAQLYVSRAELYSNAGEYADALEDLDAAIAIVNDEPLLYILRAGTHERLDRPTSTADAAADYLAYVSLIETDTTQGQRLVPGSVQVIELTEGAVVAFTFSGKAGDLWSIRAEANPNDQVDPLLILLAPDNTPLAGDDDGGARTARGLDAQITDYELPADGTYIVLVTHSLGGSEGQVAVGVQVE